ncbi:MAG: glucokinase [Oscillochloridaceae bacterium]|nr:glucokinase [Chloroflexaceae bacterium]MDW8390858.1 glucokinase [Oscillochloridaceae bacterium]
MFLAGDIGGTKTALVLVSRETGPRHFLATATFPSSKYQNLETIVSEFLADHPATLEGACFGVAGPVLDQRAEITNMPWVIDGRALSAHLGGVPVKLINDLVAFAQSVPYLQPEHLATLNPGIPDPQGTIAVIAPGTGLGEAYLTWEYDHYRARPSEGGHASFAPTTPLEVELLSYMLEHHNHVSYERLCSGLGIPNLYAFFRDRVFRRETAEIAAALAVASDPTPVIVDGALDPATPCPLCTATLDCFLGILGSEMGNLALKVFATGGVYLGGGIPPRILTQLRTARLLNAMRNKGRFRSLMERTPVHVILDPRAALVGAAAYGLID